MESDGVPIFRDIGVRRIQDLPLVPWKRLGGRGTYIQLYGTEGKWGCYVVEVPGAGALNAEKHLYEEIFYVVEGRGSTEVWLDGRASGMSSSGSPARSFRSRSMPGIGSSMPRRGRRCSSPARPRPIS